MVQGVTLRQVLEALRVGDSSAMKKYPLAVLLTTFQKVCDAMAIAHSKGVIQKERKMPSGNKKSRHRAENE